MKTFPFLLLRKAGANLNLLERLTLPETTDFIQNYRKLSDKIARERQPLKTSLLQYFHSVPHHKKNNLILNIARDIQHHKKLKSKTINGLATILPPDLYQTLLDFETLTKNKETQAADFLRTYKQFKAKNAQTFLALTNDENFKSGLLLSSTVLFNQLEKIAGKDTSQFRKKDYQVVNGLLKYYSRMLCKTSLFSRFGSFTLARPAPIPTFCEFDFPAEKDNPYAFSQINLKAFQWLQALLREHPQLRKGLYLSLNNSLVRQENSYLFLSLKQAIPVMQHLQKNTLVEMMVGFLSTKENIKLQEVLVFLEDNIEADELALMTYVNQLIDIGFLELGANISDQDKNWIAKMIQVLSCSKMPLSVFTKKIIATLKLMLEEEKKYATSSLVEKENLIKTIYFYLDEIADSLQEENNALRDNSVFPLGKHSIFYEDYKADFSCKVNERIIERTTKDLSELCRAVPHFPVGDFNQKQVIAFFIENYEKGTEVNFLNFYFDYHSFLKDKNLPIQQNTYFESWKQAAQDYFEKTLTGKEQEIHLEPEDLLAINKKAEYKNTVNIEKQSYSFFLQFYKKNKAHQVVVNNIFTGYGKMFGRFLPMLNGAVSDAFKSQLKHQFGNIQPVEISEQSFFNANIHPNLAGAEIILPGGYAAAGNTKSITLKDLAVRYDAVTGSMILKIKKTNQLCMPIDTGFQNPADLSEMSRFLLTFSPATLPGIYLITKAINDAWKKKKGSTFVVLPQIIFKDKILLQRKTWMLSEAALPLPAEGEAAYFLKLQKWRHQHKIDKEVFVNYPKKVRTTDGDTVPDYKPQYIHFESPLLVRLFCKMISSRREAIFITEVLPGRADALSIGGEKFAGEFLLEIEG